MVVSSPTAKVVPDGKGGTKTVLGSKPQSVSKRGVLVAYLDGDTVKVGWSKWNKLDAFDPATGLSVAFQRARDAGKYAKTPPPRAIKAALPDFTARAVKYFKTADVVIG